MPPLREFLFPSLKIYFPNFENTDIFFVAVEIITDGLQQASDQIRSQDGEILRNRVQQANKTTSLPEDRILARLSQYVRYYLGEASPTKEFGDGPGQFSKP